MTRFALSLAAASALSVVRKNPHDLQNRRRWRRHQNRMRPRRCRRRHRRAPPRPGLQSQHRRPRTSPPHPHRRPRRTDLSSRRSALNAQLVADCGDSALHVRPPRLLVGGRGITQRSRTRHRRARLAADPRTRDPRRTRSRDPRRHRLVRRGSRTRRHDPLRWRHRLAFR